jgi:hypothetical protein
MSERQLAAVYLHKINPLKITDTDQLITREAPLQLSAIYLYRNSLETDYDSQTLSLPIYRSNYFISICLSKAKSTVNVRFRTQPIPNGAFRNTQISAYCPIKHPLPFQRYDIFTYRLRNPRTSQLFFLCDGHSPGRHEPARG